jgi:hypothetical protein
MIAPTTDSTTAPSTATVQPVSTLGWDTTYVASFPTVNQAIMDQKSFPQTFDYKDKTGITIQGTWSSWQLSTGGSGQDVQMTCVVDSGTATGDGQSGDLAGSELVIQVNLETVATQTQVHDPTAKSGTGSPKALKVSTDGHGADPAVTVISTSTFPKITDLLLQDILTSVFGDYFNARIGEFNHTFAVMNLGEVADHDGFQWVKPTAFQYAVASPEDQSLEQSAFGLLAMVENNPVTGTMQQAVDVRALQSLPTDANSAFVISQNMVAKNMLMHGAIATIQGSSASDFGLSKDGLSVVNTSGVTWGHFQTKHGVISPTIAPGNFTLRADNTYVYLQITDAEYETSPGVTVHMNLTQQFTYDTVQAKDGKYVFIPDETSFGRPQIDATVSLSETLQILEIIGAVVGAVAGLLFAVGAIADAVGGAAEVTTDVGSNTGSISIDADSVEEAAAANPEEAAEENEAGADAADDGAQDPANGAQVQKCGVLTSPKFRLANGILAAVGGAVAGSIAAAKDITQQDYDDIPALDDFAANCFGASDWPGLTDYQLLSASFRESLVLALKMDQASD